MKLPVTFPLKIEQAAPDAMKFESDVVDTSQDVSLRGKEVPVIVTSEPVGPDVGLSLIDGVAAYAGYPASTDVKVRRISATLRAFCSLMFRSIQ